MVLFLFLAAFGFLVSLIICSFFTPFVIKSSLKSGMTTVDAHKTGKPVIAESGGLAPLLSFTFSFLVASAVYVIIAILDENYTQDALGVDLSYYLGGLLSVVIAGLIGLIDDVFGSGGMRWKHKILLGFLPALPLAVLQAGIPVVTIPVIKFTLDFNVAYALIVIPLGMNFAFNSYNMLAGMNGLETGMGLVSFGTVLLAALWVGNPFVLIFVSCMIGGLVVLFYFNKYPAKVLIGNAGTLMLGAGLFVVLVLGNMEGLGIGIFLLYFINFVMFFFYLRDKRSYGPNGKRKRLADIDKAQNIIPPSPWTVYWILPFKLKGIKEYTNVAFVLCIQAGICLVALILFVLSIPPDFSLFRWNF